MPRIPILADAVKNTVDANPGRGRIKIRRMPTIQRGLNYPSLTGHCARQVFGMLQTSFSQN